MQQQGRTTVSVNGSLWTLLDAIGKQTGLKKGVLIEKAVTYFVQKNRDALVAHLRERGVEAKIHYPVPVHLQPAAAHLGYRLGSFPVCEQDCQSIVTLPAHQHLRDEEIDYTIQQVRAFYLEGGR